MAVTPNVGVTDTVGVCHSATSATSRVGEMTTDPDDPHRPVDFAVVMNTVVGEIVAPTGTTVEDATAPAPVRRTVVQDIEAQAPCDGGAWMKMMRFPLDGAILGTFRMCR